MKLRPYQINSLNQIHQAWQKHRSVMFQMPTGTGKTVLFNEIAHSERQQDNHVLIIAHRKELVEQIAHRLESTFGEPVGIIMSGYLPHPERLIQVASIQTLHRREYPNSSVIIIDEAHHATAATYRRLWEEYPNAKFLGVTATPIRLSGEGFTDLFDILIKSHSIDSFIKQGYLAKIKYLGNPKIIPDLRKITTDKGGDFDSNQLSREMRKELIMANLTKSYFEFAKDKKIIVFAVDIEHSLSIVKRYQELGVTAEHIDANTPKKEREQILERFRHGKIKILSNVNIVSEGFDVPDCDGVQLARPTKSLGLYLQQIGRCMRPAEGKDYAIILDNVGLYEVFGSPKAERHWSLEPNLSIKLETDEAITRLCASRNHNKPLESNDLNLVILEDVEVMTIDEIRDQIKELEDAIIEGKKSLNEANSTILQKSLKETIHQCEQKKSELEVELQKALERESKEKLEELFNEFKDYFQMFINDERLNNASEKINFIDKIIEFIKKEKLNMEDKFIHSDDDKKNSELMDDDDFLDDDLDHYDDFDYDDFESSENNAFSQSTSNRNSKTWDLTQLSTINSSSIPEKTGTIRPRGQLSVIINGKLIQEKSSNETFVEVIKLLGIEKIKRLNINGHGADLISTKEPTYMAEDGEEKVYNHYKVGQYYIMTNTNNKTKKRILEDIAKKLSIIIKVEI